ncbi:winged helix-turn-helix transcriptional regulator [Rhodococcus sp. UNC363MFTsu5.1]|uniref:winged helix-turn-helix transcriptional regulator n=1 Tax=Rhodococcus sp. UNC363MFTsu5.1 TaxID=1449069 RepID=UPI00068C9A9B|nr:helix-turn-helix domain-containing protein [Rhodococcus sp. UNC363MFTsu5.1]
MTCTLSETLAVIGERWALLIVREVALGLRRFDELRAATGAPRGVLSDRLQRLIAAGVLTTRDYRVPGSRARQEYVLTEAGLDLLPVLAAFSDWGEKHLADGGVPEVVYRHTGCGGRVTARLVCECGGDADVHERVIAQVNR